MWLIARVIKWTLILQGVPTTKFGRVKNVQNLVRFLTTVDFDHKYLRNGSTYRKSEKYLINCILSPIGCKKFGELWSTNNKVTDMHVDPPNGIFLENYISAPKGRWPLKFLHVLDFDKVLLAHTAIGVGGPLKNFKGHHLKLGLKFYICTSITLGVMGITSRNFTRGCGS